jgi:hypothetical protein
VFHAVAVAVRRWFSGWRSIDMGPVREKRKGPQAAVTCAEPSRNLDYDFNRFNYTTPTPTTPMAAKKESLHQP